MECGYYRVRGITHRISDARLKIGCFRYAVCGVKLKCDISKT